MDELKKQIADLEKRVLDIERKKYQLTYPLDKVSEDAISRSLSQRIAPDTAKNIAWDNYFYYSSLFETLDRYTSSATGAGSVVIDVTGLILTTEAVVSANATTVLAVDEATLFSFDRPSRFRTSIQVDVFANTTFSIYGLEAGGGSYYGFRFDGTILKGVAYDGLTESTQTLASAVDGDIYVLEARFEPGKNITYLVNGETKGIITSNLPRGIVDSTSDAVAKEAGVSYFELIHSRL
jgi:hypothetical protein